MGRMATLSPLGLYRWDETIFDLMQIPSALDKPTLIDNLLSETAELEVLYPNPVVFKNLVGVWSAKQIDIWNRLYATTQYEYNPIENYNRYETGSEDGTGRTTHSGTDTTADTTAYGGADGRTEAIMQGGRDTNTRQMAEGGTEGESTNAQMAQGGQDTVTRQMAEGGTEGESTTAQMTQGGQDTVTRQMAQGGQDTVTRQMAEGGTEGESTTAQMAQGGQDVVNGTDTKGHWVAGFDSTPSGQNDGLVKQTRDQDDATTTTAYGKTESDTGSKTTTFGKTESESDNTAYGKTESESDTTAYGKTESNAGSKTTNFGKTESESDTTAYGKTESDTGSKTTTFGKTESESDTTAYGKTENITEQRTYGQTIQKSGNVTHGEQIATTNEGSHNLHAHGNIGVTTTQKLIREQRDIDLFNLYDIIIEDFKMRFCILIY